MSKNRKHQSSVLRYSSVIQAMLICTFIAGSAIGFVFQKNQINKLGQQIKQSEQRLEELRRFHESLQRALASLSSPRELDARVKRMNLGLVAPQPEQIVRLTEFPASAENAKFRLYAESTAAPQAVR